MTHVARQATISRPQQYAGTIPLLQEGNFAITFAMSGAYPMILPSHSKPPSPPSGPPRGTILAANRFGSIRGRSIIQHGLPRHRSRASEPSKAPSASQYFHPTGDETQRCSIDFCSPARMFTQQEIDHAFRNVVARPEAPDSVPEQTPAESGVELLEALIRDVDEACEEWEDNCAELLDEHRSSDGDVSPRTCPTRSEVNDWAHRTLSL